MSLIPDSLPLQILLAHAGFYIFMFLIGLSMSFTEQKKFDLKRLLKLPLRYYLFMVLAIPVHLIGLCTLLMGKGAPVIWAFWDWFHNFTD
jgi:Kef-type K+ transport system membrane component KefB